MQKKKRSKKSADDASRFAALNTTDVAFEQQQYAAITERGVTILSQQEVRY